MAESTRTPAFETDAINTCMSDTIEDLITGGGLVILAVPVRAETLASIEESISKMYVKPRGAEEFFLWSVDYVLDQLKYGESLSVFNDQC